MKFKVMVDLDGVLTDFDKKLAELLDKPLDRKADFGNDPEIWKKIDKAGTEYWSDMEWMPDGKELWDAIEKYDPTILSSPSNHISSVEGKNKWLKENLPDVPFYIEKDKAKYADSNTILIDDREKNIKKWEKAGGIGLLHKNAKDTIKKLEKIMSKEKEASYMNRFKTTTINDVIMGHLSRVAFGEDVVNPFTGEKVNKGSPVIVQEGIGKGNRGNRGQKLPNLLAVIKWENNEIISGIRDLLGDKNYKDENARILLGKVLELTDPNRTNREDTSFFKAKSDEVLKQIRDDRISGKISEELFDLLNILFKDPVDKNDIDNAKRLLSNISGNTQETGKVSDPFKSTPTQMMSPQITPWERYRNKVNLLKGMGSQMAKQGNKEAADMIFNLVDRIESVLKIT